MSQGTSTSLDGKKVVVFTRPVYRAAFARQPPARRRPVVVHAQGGEEASTGMQIDQGDGGGNRAVTAAAARNLGKGQARQELNVQPGVSSQDPA